MRVTLHAGPVSTKHQHGTAPRSPEHNPLPSPWNKVALPPEAVPRSLARTLLPRLTNKPVLPPEAAPRSLVRTPLPRLMNKL